MVLRSVALRANVTAILSCSSCLPVTLGSGLLIRHSKMKVSGGVMVRYWPRSLYLWRFLVCGNSMVIGIWFRLGLESDDVGT